MPRPLGFLLLLFLFLTPALWNARAEAPSPQTGTGSRLSPGIPSFPIFNATALGDQLPLDHGWIFHPGDDPTFASHAPVPA